MFETFNQGIATLAVGAIIGLVGVVYSNVVRRIKNCEDLDKTINGQLGDIQTDVAIIKNNCKYCSDEPGD